MIGIVTLLFHVMIHSVVRAQDASTSHLSIFGAGGGPRLADKVYHLLDGSETPWQSNAAASSLTSQVRSLSGSTFTTWDDLTQRRDFVSVVLY